MIRFAAGSAVSLEAVNAADPDLSDALFLHTHPGWSPRDLDEAPERLVSLMRLVATKTAAAQNRDE